MKNVTDTSESAPSSALDLPKHAQLAAVQDPAATAIVALLQSPDALKNVEAMEKLTDLYLKLQAAGAEKEFAAAFNALQSEMPAIRAMKPVPNKDGTIRYHFAPFEDIMEQVAPLTRKHGFTLSFSSEFRDDRVIQTCTLQHISGHKRSNSFGARVGQGPPGSSSAQGDGAASTYAKRFALCDALNIVIEKDSDGIAPDARAIGDVISKDKAQYLSEQIRELGGEDANTAFFTMAGVGKGEYAKITDGSYPVLVKALELKKKNRK